MVVDFVRMVGLRWDCRCLGQGVMNRLKQGELRPRKKKRLSRELFCVGRAPGMGDVGAKNTEGCATGTLEGIRKEVLGGALVDYKNNRRTRVSCDCLCSESEEGGGWD